MRIGGRLSMSAIVMLLVVAMVAPIQAQGDYEVLVDGLRNPRNMSFDSAGNLYVAEAGISGPQTTNADEPFGASSRITMINPEGEAKVVVNGLISYLEPDTYGAHAVHVTDTSIWVLLGETHDFSIPWTHALVELDKETGRVQTFIDLLELELTEDPDGNPNEQANASDFVIADDGSILIANAGCNCLMAWSADAGLSVAAAWDYQTDNPVPTSVQIGPNGDIYVGFLTGFPFPPGGARIERWSGGELAETYTGLTAVTGLLVTDDGTIYAVEFGGSFDPNAGFTPGRVVMVTSDGITPIAEGLNYPYGITQAPDGRILVSVNSLGGVDGQILVIQ